MSMNCNNLAALLHMTDSSSELQHFKLQNTEKIVQLVDQFISCFVVSAVLSLNSTYYKIYGIL